MECSWTVTQRMAQVFLKTMTINEVLDNIFISDAKSIFDNGAFTVQFGKLHIEAIMTLSSACIPVFSKPSSSKLQMDIRYKFLHMLDTESQEILSNQLLEQALNFIEQTQQNEKPIPIVVHCESGISRSATVIIAYLMRKLTLDYENALEFLRQKHPTASPNKNFESQLRLYEKMGFRADPLTLRQSAVFRDFRFIINQDNRG